MEAITVMVIVGSVIGIPVLLFLGVILDALSCWILSVREGVVNVWRALIYGR